MLKYAEIKDKAYNKFAEARLKIQNRIEEYRAEEKRKLESKGTLDVEFTNNWRERVNRVNENDELVFEAYHKKIRQYDGDNYVLNIRTKNLTGFSESDGSSEDSSGEDSSEENQEEEGHEPEQEEESESEDSEVEQNQSGDIETDEEQEDKIPEELKKEIEDLELTVTVEDEEGRSESLDVELSGSQETDSEEGHNGDNEESDDEGIEEDTEKYSLGEEAVDKLYLDVGILFAHEINENEDVQVPFQRTVLREEYAVENIYHAEHIVQEAIDTFDAKRFDEKLEEADEEDLL